MDAHQFAPEAGPVVVHEIADPGTVTHRTEAEERVRHFIEIPHREHFVKLVTRRKRASLGRRSTDFLSEQMAADGPASRRRSQVPWSRPDSRGERSDAQVPSKAEQFGEALASPPRGLF